MFKESGVRRTNADFRALGPFMSLQLQAVSAVDLIVDTGRSESSAGIELLINMRQEHGLCHNCSQ
jgi:hypothetical protein